MARQQELAELALVLTPLLGGSVGSDGQLCSSLHLRLLTCEVDPLRQMTCGVSLSVVGGLSLPSLPFRRESEAPAVIHLFIQQYFPS